MRFAHFGDTHIRNLKYHKEYRVVFSRIYEKLRELEVDYIIHCGDIAHTKTQISPEFVDMCSDFLKNLADIAPTYVILGNHDGNLRNSSRQDALTPIVNALEHSNLYLLKDSGEANLDEKFTLNVLSVFDRKNWIDPTDKERINIALYHGTVSGIETDTGWVMEHGENDINIFDNFDYAFLGDIHKTDQRLDKDGKIRYCGSTIQQNHGETNDKGFLVWDIDDRDTYECTHYAIDNPKPFITIKLTPKGRLPNKLEIQKGARLRLVSENNLPLDAVRKAVDVAKSRFKPEAVTYLNRSAGERGNVEDLANSLVQEDLRDVAVQEELISEYLSDYQPEEETLDNVYRMNRKYNTIVEEEEEVSRNINWKLKKIEWDNLFNYGEGNSIQFSNLEGIVGVFGKNFSGKSSIIDSFLYTLYNTTSKNSRKNLNLINQNRDDCRGYVEIDIGSKTYRVERKSTKYIKRLKGKETLEAKTDVEFDVLDNATGDVESLNGTSRLETDKNIRKVFGTLEDFLTTSMASQLESLSYISEGSTRRKEILAKFLDLEVFEKKFKLCKEDASDLKGAIRRLSDRDFEEERKQARTKLARQEAKLSVKERTCESLTEKIKNLESELLNVNSKIDSIPAEVIDITEVKNDIKVYSKESTSLKATIEEKTNEFEKQTEFLTKIQNFVDSFNIEDTRNKKKIVDSYQQQILEIETELKEFDEKRQINSKKIDILKTVPCGKQFQKSCQFVNDAYLAIDNLRMYENKINQSSLRKKTLGNKREEMNPTKLDDYIEKYEKILERKIHQQNIVSSIELELERGKSKLFHLANTLDKLKEKEGQYNSNKEAIENLENLLKDKETLENEIENANKEFESCRAQLLDLYRKNGSLEQKHDQVVKEEEEFHTLENEFTVSDLFMRCMHSNGISYDIIKKRLPLINSEVSKILTNIVEFEIMFVNDDKKLDILIKHPNYDPRPIEMGSGAEKTIAAMAIRLALLNVSTLPKGDIFILDEPGTALDAENMEGFIRILDMIKTQFKTVLLISHLESLKDIVDKQIIIEKSEGFACVNE